jgi:hypothetical protein
MLKCGVFGQKRSEGAGPSLEINPRGITKMMEAEVGKGRRPF